MLSYSEVKPKTYIELDGEPYEVLESHVFRKQQRKPVNQTKLRNLISGRVVEKTFHAADKITEAELERKELKFLYQKKDEFWFSAPNNLGDRQMLGSESVGDTALFMKQGEVVAALIYNDEVIGLSVPIKVHVMVKEAPPNVRGNTSQGGTKPVIIETGATINTPLFIEVGDTIEVNTETGEYVTRVEKGK